MIHFDTNVLIALPLWSHRRHAAIRRVAAGEPGAVCSIVWYEFAIGPIDGDEIELNLQL